MSLALRICVSIFLLCCGLAGQQYTPPQAGDIRAPARGDDPLLCASAAELQRLRRAFADQDPVLLALVQRARRSARKALAFPPRGGQHNQWYQCEACQLGLKTVNPSTHRCPGCRKVYRGAPYDDVIFSRQHRTNAQRASDSAWGFALSGDAALAADSRRILLGYAARYRQYPYHTNSRGGSARKSGGGHILEQSLSEASLMLDRILPACDLVWGTFSPGEIKQLREGLLRPMARNLLRAKRGRSNWQSFHNAALFGAGVLLEDAALMQRSILAPKNGFLFQMHSCVSSDGMWYENSWGYHLYTLRALAGHAEFARRCGIDLWGHPAMRKMVELPAAYTMPNGRLPRLGDDVNSDPRRHPQVIEAAVARFGLAGLQALLPTADNLWSLMHGRSPSAPALRQAPPRSAGSRVFRGAGHAILRSGIDDRLCAVLSFGPFGGFHGHFDKLSFVLYGKGRELGVDPGRAKSQAYRLPIHKRWYRATIAHNAVVVDGVSQRGAAGELLLFEQGEGFQAVAAQCDTAYPGVRHARCMILTGNQLLVIDRLESRDKERRFDWLYHGAGQGIQLDIKQPARDVEDLGLDGQEFLTARRIHTEGRQDAVHGRVGHTILQLAAGPKTTVYSAQGPFSSVQDRIPMLGLRRVGKAVDFVVGFNLPVGIGVHSRRQGKRLIVELRDQVGLQETQTFSWDGSKVVRAF